MVLRLFSSIRGTRSDSFVANGSQHISSANTPTLVFPTELVQLPCIIQFLQSSWSNTITSIAAPRPRRFSQRTMIGPQTVLQFVVDKDALPSEWPKMVREFWLAHRMILRNHKSWDQYTGKEYVWTAVSFNYTFPGLDRPPSHFGFSASCGFGNSDASRNLSKQAKLGLAVEF